MALTVIASPPSQTGGPAAIGGAPRFGSSVSQIQTARAGDAVGASSARTPRLASTTLARTIHRKAAAAAAIFSQRRRRFRTSRTIRARRKRVANSAAGQKLTATRHAAGVRKSRRHEDVVWEGHARDLTPRNEEGARDGAPDLVSLRDAIRSSLRPVHPADRARRPRRHFGGDLTGLGIAFRARFVAPPLRETTSARRLATRAIPPRAVAMKKLPPTALAERLTAPRSLRALGRADDALSPELREDSPKPREAGHGSAATRGSISVRAPLTRVRAGRYHAGGPARHAAGLIRKRDGTGPRLKDLSHTVERRLGRPGLPARQGMEVCVAHAPRTQTLSVWRGPGTASTRRRPGKSPAAGGRGRAVLPATPSRRRQRRHSAPAPASPKLKP